MYYNTPNVKRYLGQVKRYRLWIILGYLVAALLAVAVVRPEILVSDTKIWLAESDAYQRANSENIRTEFITRLVVRPGSFDEEVKTRLLSLHKRLGSLEGVSHVVSLFSLKHIYNEKHAVDSSMVTALELSELTALQLQTLMKERPERFRPFYNQEVSEFTFFVYSDQAVLFDTERLPYPADLYSLGQSDTVTDQFLYGAIVFAIFFLLFHFLFRNYISIVSGLLIISLTFMFTVSLVQAVYPDVSIHLSMSLIIVAIAMVDYLYYYYRWHVSQYRADVTRALTKMINRNLNPAFWTSFITILGLGALLFADSSAVKVLSLSVIGASTIAYLLNNSLLPALLSYFHVKHPKVAFGRFGYYFSNREMHYNRRYLQVFLILTSIVIALGAYNLMYNKKIIFADMVYNDVIVVKTPYIDINTKKLEQVRSFEKALLDENPGVVQVVSVSSVLKELTVAETESDVCSNENLLHSLFFLELYNLEETLYDETLLNIVITLDKTDKSSVIRWLQNYDGMQLYLTDINTLLSSVKVDQTVVLGLSLAAALLIIGLIMGMIFQNIKMVVVGFIVNAIPIAWFGLFAHLMGIQLSVEMLIAMTITVGIASDATVHFAYKYLRSRYFNRTQKHALEIMFFYAGIPVIIGSIVLISAFLLLSMTEISSLQMIGTYGGILMIISLCVDLFILPVMLLAIDKKKEPADMQSTGQNIEQKQ